MCVCVCVCVQSQKESKRVEQLEKKLANQKLLEEEEQTLKGSAQGGASATKVTRAQIQETKVTPHDTLVHELRVTAVQFASILLAYRLQIA